MISGLGPVFLLFWLHAAPWLQGERAGERNRGIDTEIGIGPMHNVEYIVPFHSDADLHVNALGINNLVALRQGVEQVRYYVANTPRRIRSSAAAVACAIVWSASLATKARRNAAGL